MIGYYFDVIVNHENITFFKHEYLQLITFYELNIAFNILLQNNFWYFVATIIDLMKPIHDNYFILKYVFCLKYTIDILFI